MSELVRDDACRETDLMAHLMKIVAELSNERFFAARPRQKKPIVGQLFQGAKEAQPPYELANKRIHWDQSFGF